MIAVEIEDAWRQFLVQRWEVPEDADSSRWGDILASRDVDSEIAAAMGKLASDLHYLRFAPQLSSTESLRSDLFETSRVLLRGLR